MESCSVLITKNISFPYRLSFAVGALTAAVSLVSIIFQSSIYPLEEVRHSSVATDMVNLFLVIPILFGAMILARRGKMIGLLFWPGALFIITYHYLAYTAGLLSAWQVAVYLFLVLISAYTIYDLISRIDWLSVQRRLAGSVPERFAGAVLVGFGILFFFWRGSLVVQSFIGSAPLTKPELTTAIADMLISPAWVIVGVLLWRKKAFGYVSGAGLLFQFSMLFIGLFVYFALQPVLAGIAFPVNDFLAVFVMSLVCFIPFGMFVKGLITRPAG